MTEALLLVGVAVALFVGYNIGGSNTGPAFGPAVGSGALSKTGAAALMTVFFFAGGWTIGRRVVDTLGSELVTDPGVFTLPASITVLFFIGLALFVGNVFGVPASTSMTAVGAIAGLGLASGALDWAVMGEIVSWWLVAPIIGFWVSAVIGRYFYPALNRRIALVQSDGPLVTVDREGALPTVETGPGTTRRELFGTGVVVGIGCIMAFSSGTSNVANAIAPLVGSGEISMNIGIAIACLAVGVGAFTIARRTLDTLGSDITSLPLTAAIVVATVSSLLVIGLSAIKIPASFVVIATMSIIGLGWGRATRTVRAGPSITERASDARVSVGALAADTEGEAIPDMGEEDPADIPAADELFSPGTTARVLVLQNVVPVISTVGAYIVFRFVPFFGF
ncbi:MAG: phosphate/sulfate permease [Halonotius sp. J07HN6]|nr:MAG: phosphate/sulfate permease [Halonotius sp. J07HN6]